MQVEKNIFAANSIAYTLNQPPLAFAGGVSFDFTGKGFIGGGGVGRGRGAREGPGHAAPRAEVGGRPAGPPGPGAAAPLHRPMHLPPSPLRWAPPARHT